MGPHNYLSRASCDKVRDENSGEEEQATLFAEVLLSVLQVFGPCLRSGLTITYLLDIWDRGPADFSSRRQRSSVSSIHGLCDLMWKVHVPTF